MVYCKTFQPGIGGIPRFRFLSQSSGTKCSEQILLFRFGAIIVSDCSDALNSPVYQIGRRWKLPSAVEM
jgi:hypothetical protein